MYPDMSCANVPCDVLNAWVGHGYAAEEEELANTTVIFLLDNPRRRQAARLSTCRQIHSDSRSVCAEIIRSLWAVLVRRCCWPPGLGHRARATRVGDRTTGEQEGTEL